MNVYVLGGCWCDTFMWCVCVCLCCVLVCGCVCLMVVCCMYVVQHVMWELEVFVMLVMLIVTVCDIDVYLWLLCCVLTCV